MSRVLVTVAQTSADEMLWKQRRRRSVAFGKSCCRTVDLVAVQTEVVVPEPALLLLLGKPGTLVSYHISRLS